MKRKMKCITFTKNIKVFREIIKYIFADFLPKGRGLSLFNGIVDTILGVSRRNLDLLNMFQFCSALVSLGHKDLPNIWMTNASLINIQGPRSA